MKKYKIDFIEEPDVFDFNNLNQIYGGGLCIGFNTQKDCGCNMTSNKGSYCGRNDTDSEKQQKGKDKKKDHRKFMGKYNDTFCIIVKITQ